MTIHKTDVAIIGAGPVGLFAIFECGMMSMKCHVIDALSEIGGQCIALYPEKPIYDIPACPKILAKDLIARLEEQAAPFHPTYHLGQNVVKLLPTDDERWDLETSLGTKINAKAVIIAAGVGAFGPNRPPLDGLEAFEGKSIFYYVKDPNRFKDRTVVIAGGGDSAVDWALSLAPLAKKIYMVHRRDKFRAAPESVNKLHALADTGAIELVVPYQLESVRGEHGQLKEVGVQTLDGEHRTLPADDLLLFFGLSMNLGPIAEWGLDLHKNHIEVSPINNATSASGIFAIGDVASYENKQKLILTGFAEAARAAYVIRSLVYPGEVFHFEYSTTQGVPK
ncbi:MAG: NAD(P)/FAD-dependent oxidoreductase [Alphaproteobacteria bacterium]|nr:NAD(P)/FAD-dependent oxidoreductase [Alphaproteobacteria bacterium]